jgi:phytoene desaturase
MPNRDRSVEGLYHVGGGTHPGAGIPGVLMGAQVTADLALAA